MFRSAAYPRLLLTGAALIPIFTFFYTDYSAWYNLGQGGAPRNPFGYLLIKLLGAAFGSSDLYSTGVYDVMRRRDVFEEESFLEGRLDRREGSRPRVSRWVAPVRQLSGGSPEEVKEVSYSSESSIFIFSIRVLEVVGRILDVFHLLRSAYVALVQGIIWSTSPADPHVLI